MSTFGITSASSIEATESQGAVLNETAFKDLIQSGNSTVNLRIPQEAETQELMDNDFAFSVPEPFGSYRQNLSNQKATPVFRQNCFVFEAPKPSKVVNRFPKKLTPKRLQRKKPMRI
ncbi:hypothetical protein ACFFRR_011518 [Megaselia abdita]